MNNRLSLTERRHLERVKSLPCSVCDAPPLSEAHHIRQGLQWTCIALCPECHRGSQGWHGTKALWRVRKMDEMDALNVTIKRVVRDMREAQ